MKEDKRSFQGKILDTLGVYRHGTPFSHINVKSQHEFN